MLGINFKRDKIAEILHLPSSPSPFSQGGRRGAGAQSVVSCSLGEGWGEDKCNMSRLKLVPDMLKSFLAITVEILQPN
jgi:hypothetical protein